MSRLENHPPVDERARAVSLAELEQAVRAADPNAFFVPPRILRRVIKEDADLSGIGLRVPHRKTYVISRAKLLLIVDRSELDLESDAELPELVILIARPSSEDLATLDGDAVLLKFWRQLFHARVHLALEQKSAEGRLTSGDVAARIQQIGAIEFQEIRSVLRLEEYLLPPRTDRSVYVEFAAVYLELRHFVPSFLRSYFPSLTDLHEVDAILRHDVDAEALLRATRPAGAPPSGGLGEQALGEHGLPGRDDGPPRWVPNRLPARKRSPRVAAGLIAKADEVGRLGNLVRAAMLRTRAARFAEPEVAHHARDKARAELGRLARRLQAALQFTDNEADEWTRSICSLLEQASRGIWTAEARLLYDLQKVCVDHERGIYTLDLMGWAFSLGRKPLKRFLPGQRDVLISKHLRGAQTRLASAALSQRARSRLAALLQSAVHRAEDVLRARFMPLVDRALDQVKLFPQNPPERVARKKLVDEILDRIVERGFFSMGDLRDALSSNNLKLPDLASFRQFLSGDQLLQADRLLAGSLDSVYRGGEVYRRWPQRFSSLAFGTPPGRFLTRYLAIPFGGAAVALEGLQKIIHEVGKLFSHESELHLANYFSVALLGSILLGLIYNQRFRSASLEGLVRVGQGIKIVFVDFPRWLRQMPLIERIVHSWQYRAFKRYVFKPLVFSAVAAPLIATVSDRSMTFNGSVAIFLVVNVILNSRIGRNVDELVTDWVVSTWHRIRIHVFAAMYRTIMEAFNRLLEVIERFLYTVDEWLRFRAGERRSATVTKAVLGFAWFFVNYVIRFCVTLLVEPQLNPIKHFPVVTVSHKFLIPMAPGLTAALSGPLGPWAVPVAGTITLLTPGIFGFLVWELKANWQLYAANRPPNLRPVAIGHHGETVLQFLRPGFRSGTVPKLYAKLRSASRKAYWTHDWKACTKHLDGLHHCTTLLRRFTDRELLELLHESRTWNDRSITTGEIRLGCNRILIELYWPDIAEESMWLAFEDQSGWLVASIHRRGWADSLSPPRRHTLASALAGFYKMAGVDLVREQIESRLEFGSRGYQVTDEGLKVWPAEAATPRLYPLSNWPELQDRSQPPPPDLDRWVFAAAPISWRRWVATWELDQLGGISKHHGLDDGHLLPS